jgi:hypothetical protein
MTDKKKPGPKPETFKVPLEFEDAVRAALSTKLGPGATPPKRKPRKPRS